MTPTPTSTPPTAPTHRTIRPLATAALCLVLCLPSFAQTSPQPAVPPSPNDWSRVQALPLQTRIKVVADKSKSTCFVTAVTEDRLTCSRSQPSTLAEASYPRAEIRQIKLTHRGRSAGQGAALGFAIGAAAGAAVGLAINASAGTGGVLSPSIRTTKSKAAGAGAAVGGVAAGLLGGALGYGLDIFAGPVIYQRPRS